MLDRTLECWLAGHDPQAPTPTAAPDQKPVHESAVFDHDGLMNRLMGDDQLARKVLMAFLTDVPYQIAALAKAVNDADAATARRTAHSIKGAAACAGGQALRDAARRAEELGEAGDLASVGALLPELQRQLEKLRTEVAKFCDQAT